MCARNRAFLKAKITAELTAIHNLIGLARFELQNGVLGFLADNKLALTRSRQPYALAGAIPIIVVKRLMDKDGANGRAFKVCAREKSAVANIGKGTLAQGRCCLLYTSPSPRDRG